MNNIVKSTILNTAKYRGLLKQLVQRDVKLKYRRSVLGYLWSVLNPLLIMIVLTIVFSNLFKFSIENFPLYLLSGQVIFNFFSAVTNSCCFTILDNGALLKKTYVPKYIFVFAKVFSGFVDFLFSLTALILLMIITKAKFSIYNLLFFLPAIELLIFCVGIGLLLSQANVFFRDIQYIHSVFVTALSYLTPLFYPLDILPESVLFFVTKLNPLYIYVALFRQCVYENIMLDSQLVVRGLCWAIASLIIGGLFFKKKQDEFILYI